MDEQTRIEKYIEDIMEKYEHAPPRLGEPWIDTLRKFEAFFHFVDKKLKGDTTDG